MQLERSNNINTEAYWDKRYETIVTLAPVVRSTNNFFGYGLLPTDEECTVLDIGCGAATHYPEIHKRYPKAKFTGADISKFATDHNRKNYLFAKFLHMDIETMPLNETYDYIISSHTFEHLTHPVRALEKCLRQARKDVLICVPYKESWSYDHEHMHTFSETEPLTGHNYYFLEYDITNNVGGITFRFSGLAK